MKRANEMNQIMKRLSVAIVMVSLIAGCGSTSDSDTDEDTSTTSIVGISTGQLSLSIPSIDFLLPSSDSASLLLTDDEEDQGDPDGLLTGWVDRINQNVTSLNADVDRMNEQSQYEIMEIDDDVYDYEVVVCEDGEVSTITRWSADGSAIASERDLNQKPDDPENVRVKTYFSIVDDVKTLTMHFFGEPKGLPSGADGPAMASYDEAVQLEDGNFTMKGVTDWHEECDVLSADDYLTGALDTSGEGEFVNWSNRDITACEDITSFDEEATEGQWCNSKEIGSDDYYTLDEADTAWEERLAAIGVAPAENLSVVPIENICPE